MGAILIPRAWVRFAFPGGNLGIHGNIKTVDRKKVALCRLMGASLRLHEWLKISLPAHPLPSHTKMIETVD